MKFTKLLLAATTAALCAACGIPPHYTDISDDPPPEKSISYPDPPHAVSPDPRDTPSPGASGEMQLSPGSMRDRACGSFLTIDKLTVDTIAPAPEPGLPNSRPRQDLIGLANSLSTTIDRQSLSPALNAAITAHVAALANLGAVVNHGSPRDDIADLAAIVNATGRTIRVLCDA